MLSLLSNDEGKHNCLQHNLPIWKFNYAQWLNNLAECELQWISSHTQNICSEFTHLHIPSISWSATTLDTLTHICTLNFWVQARLRFGQNLTQCKLNFQYFLYLLTRYKRTIFLIILLLKVWKSVQKCAINVQ